MWIDWRSVTSSNLKSRPLLVVVDVYVACRWEYIPLGYLAKKHNLTKKLAEYNRSTDECHAQERREENRLPITAIIDICRSWSIMAVAVSLRAFPPWMQGPVRRRKKLAWNAEARYNKIALQEKIR